MLPREEYEQEKQRLEGLFLQKDRDGNDVIPFKHRNAILLVLRMCHSDIALLDSKPELSTRFRNKKIKEATQIIQITIDFIEAAAWNYESLRTDINRVSHDDAHLTLSTRMIPMVSGFVLMNTMLWSDIFQSPVLSVSTLQQWGIDISPWNFFILYELAAFSLGAIGWKISAEREQASHIERPVQHVISRNRYLFYPHLSACSTSNTPNKTLYDICLTFIKHSMQYTDYVGNFVQPVQKYPSPFLQTRPSLRLDARASDEDNQHLSEFKKQR